MTGLSVLVLFMSH